MDEPTKPKRNRAEKKNKEQQIKESEIKNVDDDDNVFNEDSQQQQVYLLLCYACRLILCMCALYFGFTYLLGLVDLFKIIKIISISEITSIKYIDRSSCNNNHVFNSYSSSVNSFIWSFDNK